MSDDKQPLARIPLAGVIGSPVAHSKSPQLHGHWLRTNGIAGYYIPMDVGADDLAQVLQTLPKMGFVGVNITVPHKERALALADLVTDRATLIGAANTLIFRKDGKLHADNTDGYGFIQNLRQNAPTWRPEAGPAAVLGAGGAARAASIEVGCRPETVSSRTSVMLPASADVFLLLDLSPSSSFHSTQRSRSTTLRSSLQYFMKPTSRSSCDRPGFNFLYLPC